jgi:hypothetical protein
MIAWQYTPYLVPLLLSAAISAALAGYTAICARRHRSTLVIAAFLAFTLLTTVWTLAHTLQVASVAPGAKRL